MKNFSNFNTGFYKETPILNPKKMVAWKKEKKIYNFKIVPKIAIISAVNCFSKKELFFLKKIKGFNTSAYLFKNVLLVLNIGVGAPSVIALMEELKALGVKKIFFFGYGGRLDNNINSGKVFKISEAYSLSGTSFFYQKESFISYKTDLHEKINLDEIKVLSVDAPFRETKSLLNEYKSKNVGLVDMETAAILAFGKFYDIPVCTVLVAADLLLPKWQPPENQNKSSKEIKKLILNCTSNFENYS